MCLNFKTIMRDSSFPIMFALKNDYTLTLPYILPGNYFFIDNAHKRDTMSSTDMFYESVKIQQQFIKQLSEIKKGEDTRIH